MGINETLCPPSTWYWWRDRLARTNTLDCDLTARRQPHNELLCAISIHFYYPFRLTWHVFQKITIHVQHNRLFTFHFYFWLLLSRAAAQIKHTLHNAFQCTRQIYIFSNLDWKLFIDHHLIYIAENVFFSLCEYLYMLLLFARIMFFFLDNFSVF